MICSPVRLQAADTWEAALDALQTEAQAEEQAPEEAPAAAPAAQPVQPARDPRMAGFRIGGQGETAEERGEGWCGPWSTAMRLIEQREQVSHRIWTGGSTAFCAGDAFHVPPLHI